MGGGGGGQAKLHPRQFHHLGNRTRVQRAAPGADEQRAVQVMRAGCPVSLDRAAGGRDHRHHPFLAALAPDPEGLRQRRIGGGQPQRLGYPQAAAIKQRHHRAVAPVDPVGLALHRDPVDHRPGGIDRQGARQFALIFRGTRRQNGGGFQTVMVGQPAIEAFHRRQLARQ